MSTTILKADDPATPQRAAEALASGELVVIPTDTVYGIAAKLDDTAILRLYEAKRRPPEKAIPILLSSADDIQHVAHSPSPQEKLLIERFWPGPLTLILEKRSNLPRTVSHHETIAVRVPDNPIARAVIRAASGALAVSSANLSGLPPAHTLEIALEQLGDTISIGVDGGLAPGRSASTIAQIIDGSVHIVRAGPLSKVQLEAALR